MEQYCLEDSEETHTGGSAQLIRSTFSTESAPSPNQSLSCDVRLFVVCLFVPYCGTQNREDWRLLVDERIA